MQKKSFFLAGGVVCLVLVAVAFYWYQQPRARLNNVKPAYTLSAIELYAAFQQNEARADEQFTDKVVQVKGIVENVQQTDSTLNIMLSANNEVGGINCRMVKRSNSDNLALNKGSMIQVKGKCVGFLMDVNLVDAVIVTGQD